MEEIDLILNLLEKQDILTRLEINGIIKSENQIVYFLNNLDNFV